MLAEKRLAAASAKCSRRWSAFRHELRAPRVYGAGSRSAAVRVPAVVLARAPRAWLPRARRRAFRVLRLGAAFAAGDLAACGVGRRDARGRAARARVANRLSGPRDPADAHDADRPRDRPRAFR